MTRYTTTEEKITCKHCQVEFTNRELTDGMCPRCDKYPFCGVSLEDLKRAFGGVKH